MNWCYQQNGQGRRNRYRLANIYLTIHVFTFTEKLHIAMQEHQHVEWKETWKDEYLKWICGFANADGGTLIIGRNDAGVAVGVSNAKKLLEDIPNKVRDILGIMVNVNLHEEQGYRLLAIVVDPYPSPVSYKGEYHFRSGSTKQVTPQ